MSKRSISPIVKSSIRLRLLNKEDLPLTLAWRNQDNIRKWFFYSAPITPQQHENWFKNYLERDNDFVFIIEEVSEGFRPVGQVAIYNIDWEGLRAEFGRLMIGEPSAAGKGLASAATQAVLELSFEKLGLQEIYLEVYSNNVKAVSLYKSVGFKLLKVRDNIIKMNISKP